MLADLPTRRDRWHPARVTAIYHGRIAYPKEDADEDIMDEPNIENAVAS